MIVERKATGKQYSHVKRCEASCEQNVTNTRNYGSEKRQEVKEAFKKRVERELQLRTRPPEPLKDRNGRHTAVRSIMKEI